jgi:holo-[acyl-carrier protein] synthase
MEAQFGLGVDIENVSRFRVHIFAQEKKFWENIFSKKELKWLAKYKDPYTHATGIFTAKEAVVKALYSLGQKIFIREIEVKHDSDGRPIISLLHIKDIVCQVSISHTSEYALASALCQRNSRIKEQS